MFGRQGFLGGGQRQIAIFVRAVIDGNRPRTHCSDFDAVDIRAGSRAFRNRQLNAVSACFQGHGDGLEQPVVEPFYRPGTVWIGRQHIEHDRRTAVDHKVQRAVSVGGIAHADVVLPSLGHIDLPSDVISCGIAEVQIASA